MKSLILFLLVLSFSFAQPARATSFSAPVEVAATAASTQALPPNAFRSYLLIVNKGSIGIVAKFGSAQTGVEGVPIAAGAMFEPHKAPGDSVWLVSVPGSATTAAVTLIQGQ